MHGGKTLFLARFLPGLRAAIYFSAGIFRLPFWKMLAFDGSAAVISVPTLVLAAYFGGEQIEKVRHWTQTAQILLVGAIAIGIGLVVAWKLISRRKVATAK
jgi:membrane protein DedA with SNARE-associated domain